VKTDPALEARFKRIKAKLIGYMDDPTTALRKYPETDRSAAAHYARAYAWHRGAYPEKAMEEVDKLVASAPDDPYYRELQGQILLESGKPKEALEPLRMAVKGSRASPLISSLLGHALIATEDPENFAEARDVLKVSVARDRDNPFAWYALGMAYARLGDEPRAQLATAERYALLGNTRRAAPPIISAPRTSPWRRAPRRANAGDEHPSVHGTSPPAGRDDRGRFGDRDRDRRADVAAAPAGGRRGHR
jgi:predicted Zn-dependent protease